MSHHPDYSGPRNGYDDQLDKVRPQATSSLHASVEATNAALPALTSEVQILIARRVLATGALIALDCVNADFNQRAAAVLPALLPPPLKLEARKPTKIGPTRPATQSIEDLAKHFEPRGK